MIKVLFICYGNPPYFCLKCLKIKDSWGWESDLYPCCTPYLARVLRQSESEAFGLEFINRTVLDKNAYDFGRKKFLWGLLFTYQNIGLFRWNIPASAIEVA